MTERREHFALDWIKRELDETLKAARQSLEAYAESGHDETRMRACLTYVHQVHGTLLMLELNGVSVLSDEMEQLAQALLLGNVEDSGAAQQALMQSILQLPAFLEDIQKGLPDSRRAVVPLANELRACRGEKPFPDAPGGVANLHAPVTEDSLKRFDQIDGTEKARKIRAAYQQVLLSILRGQDREASLLTLNKVALGLERISEKSPLGLLWRAFGIFVKSLAAGQVELSGEVVKLLRRVDAEIKVLAQEGRAALSRPVDMDLLRTLIDDARETGFTSKDLDQLAAALASEPEEERHGISRREAMHTAAAALREELALVKDRLDLFVRSEERSVTTLNELAAPLKQIGSTLSILGFESSRSIVADQVESLNAAAAGGVVEDGVLMSAAAALLQVDENLAGLSQERNRRLGASGESTAVISAAQLAVLAEARNGLEQVKQAVVDYVSAQWDARHLEGAPDLLNAVRGALAMVPLPQAADQLGRCARYVRERLLAGETPDWPTLDAFADAISGVDYYLERLSDDAGMPGTDILGGVERSLDALGYGEGSVPAAPAPPRTAPALQVVTSEAVAADGDVEQEVSASEESSDDDLPVVDEVALPPDTDTDTDDLEPVESPEEPTVGEAFELVLEPETVKIDGDDTPSQIVSVDDVDDAFDLGGAAFAEEEREVQAELEEIDAAPAPERQALEPEPETEPEVDEAMAADAPAATVRVDDDILEIFVEEVSEVLAAVDEWLPVWAADLKNEEALTEVRRSFHTLKGSGRIVGARLIGELAWSVENMLNRVIDETIQPNAQIAMVTKEAAERVPALRDAFRDDRAADEAEIALVMERADVLASGGTLEEVSALPQPAPVERSEAEALQDDADDEAATFALFDREAGEHLDLLEARFASTDRISEVLDDDVLRALHTLRGSAAMVGIEPVMRIAGPVYQVASAVRDQRAEVTPDLVDFIQQAVFALRRTVSALRDAEEPDEELALFESEAKRLMAGLDGDDASSSLLVLDGMSTLLEAREFLKGWQSGGMDLAAMSDTIMALHELRNEAQSKAVQEVTTLADALIESYERFEERPLDEHAYAAFSAAHERLLEMFDCIAADQALPDPAAEIAALQGLPDAVTEVEEAAPELAEPPREETFSVTDGGIIELPEIIETELPSLPDEIPEAMPEAKAPAPAQSPPAPPVPAFAAAKTSEAPARESRVYEIPEEADAEILEIFFEEADELVEGMDHSIQEWLDQRDNRVHLDNLLRGLHTLKGGARLAALLELGDETHTFESFLIAAQDADSFDDRFFTGLQDHYDGIAAHVAGLKQAAGFGGGAVAEDAPSPAAKSIPPADKPAAPKPAAAKPAPVTPARMAPPPKVAELDEEEDESDTESAEVLAFTRDRGAAPAAKPTREPREIVRVSAQLLETLVNLAGETSIVRSRVEQGISDFSSALDEMETTIERVREQLRRLEIETETQVLFRHEVGQGPNYEDFDPLEMDRYSQMQQLARGLSESASDMLDLKDTLAYKSREAETLLLQQARLNTELQEGLMRTRMVPFSRLVPRLKRIVRQVAKDLGKEVELHAFNAEGELDRNVLERMVPPLEHMLRNAVDHGIERPELRRSYGKPVGGRIDLRLSREGADVVIEIADDGGGIDVESVRAKAIERGLMAKDATFKDDEILQFVLAPGFSTARSVTQISGRGVGMDVVHSAVKQLGGSIAIMSIPGKGSRFTIRLPFTVSVNRALMVSVGEDLYAVPLNTIEGIVRVPARELEQLYAPEGRGFEYAGVPYRMRYLGSFLGREYVPGGDRGSVPVVLVRSGDRAIAVHVDGVQGSREIVVKSLGAQFAGVGGISGATILGDGSVVVILDLLALIRTQTATIVTAPEPVKEDRPTCVMVVDDSVTVRKVTSRLLERQGMDVIIAKDGVEAIALLQERRPDIMLLDIEMPRMDGFEVARQVRHDKRLAKLPIIMITSRTGSKHKERAVALGVNRFLGKPFQESELLANIDELVN